MPLSFEEWMEDAPKLETHCDALRHAYRQSLVDLAALRLRPRKDLTWSLPAAGLPWFMALFGRDSLITAYQALPFQHRLAHTTLEALASLQSTDYDDYRDAEPGKIPHELRQGELVKLGEAPHDPYYGTHDATPLFLVLRRVRAVDVRRRGGPRVRPEARAALAWIDRDGDLDGDGYLEYGLGHREASRTSAGRTRGTPFSSPTGAWRRGRSQRARSRGMPTTPRSARLGLRGRCGATSSSPSSSRAKRGS